MKNLIEQIKLFYLKNRIFIISILFFILMMQVCNNGTVNNNSTSLKNEQPRKSVSTQPRNMSPIDSVIYKTINKNDRNETGNSFMLEFLLMTGLVFAFYLLQKRGLLEKILPQKVSVRSKLIKKKETGETLLTIEIINKTKDSITFEPPVLTFKRFSKTRSFKIKGNDGVSLFPLTLTPGTSHKLTINIDRMKNNIPELQKYKNIYVTVKTDTGKIHQSTPGRKFFT
ncbi:MAG: hypothetical protein GXO47_05200 [Chlorobi bacterium]|nr:hypothetical protein [Chlorobiota bacterium]